MQDNMNLSTSVLEKFSHLSFHYHSLLLSQFSIFCTKVVLIDPIPRVLDFLTDGIFSQHRHNICLSFQIEPSFGDLQTTALLETFHPHPWKSFPEQWHGLTSTMKKMHASQSWPRQLLVKHTLYARDLLPNGKQIVSFFYLLNNYDSSS